MDSNKIIDNACLVCLKSDEKVFLTSNIPDLDLTYHDAFAKFTAKSVNKSNFVCCKCACDLIIAYNFITKLEKSTRLLNIYLSNEELSTDKIVCINGNYNVNEFAIKEASNSSQEDNYDAGCSSSEEDIKYVPVIEKNIGIVNFSESESQISKSAITDETEEDPDYMHNVGQLTKTKIKEEPKENQNFIKIEPSEKITKLFKRREKFIPKCIHCNKIFGSRSVLNTHIRVIHERRELTTCCDKKFYSRSSYCHHMLFYHSDKEYKCEECDKVYKSTASLNLHKRIHENRRNYLCTVCGKDFNHPSSLKYHLGRHKGTLERKFQCIHCPLSFVQKSSLNSHLLRHTGIKPHGCDYCGKGFATKTDLSSHIRIHTGHRPYKCEHCDKDFTKLHTLKVHHLSHRGRALCKLCYKSFLTKEYLERHQRWAHKSTDVVMV